MKIKVLPDSLANHIAAGEVVERPAAVVRELVDNSVDAGATLIIVEIEGGGRSLIRVVDNGCGMSRDDALLSFERHATSKVSTLDDLDRIQTLGFRGEALPSIAAVSRVRISTRAQEESAGIEIILQAGALKGVSSCPRSIGTEIEVRQLFFNTPARRKFLKSERVEEQKIKQWILQTSLAQPKIQYRLLVDGREVLNLPPRETQAERANALFRGAFVSFGLDQVPVETRFSRIRVCGMLAHPAMAQAESSGLCFLVNGRLVSDKLLLRAVREGFESTLKDREFPVGYVSVEIAPSDVDVNVHPQKSEVRFRSPQDVFVAVNLAVAQAVKNFRSPVVNNWQSRQVFPGSKVVSLPLQQPNPIGDSRQPELGSVNLQLRQDTQQNLAVQTRLVAPQESTKVEFANPRLDNTDELESPFRFSELRFLGQALSCYLLCEARGALYVVDMHAAHERYNFNLIRNRLKSRTLESQQLLLPITVELNTQGVQACQEHEAALGEIGFEIESFGETTVIVRAAPAIIKQQAISGLVKEFAAVEMIEQISRRLDEHLDHIAARLACHASVRSGEDLKEPEVQKLFSDLDRSEFSAACPHGRPVVVRFSQVEIEAWFGRDR